MSKNYYKNLDTDKLTELKEVKLAKLQEIQLSLIGDAENLKRGTTANLEIIRDAIEQGKEAREMLQDAFVRAGMVFDLVDNAYDDQQSDEKMIEDMLGELVKGAEALGLDATDIEVYKELALIQDAGVDLSAELEDLFQYFDNVL